jgi:hypothetical protein
MEPSAVARASAPGLPPLHPLDAVLGPGVVRWRPTGGPDDACGVPGLHFPGPATRALDSEHMQQHGISQVRRRGRRFGDAAVCAGAGVTWG